MNRHLFGPRKEFDELIGESAFYWNRLRRLTSEQREYYVERAARYVVNRFPLITLFPNDPRLASHAYNEAMKKFRSLVVMG